MALSPDKLKDLEDEAIRHYVQKHNEYLTKVNEVNFNEASPFLLANVEHWYSWARNYAFQIASYYRKRQRHYEAQSKIKRADYYEQIRNGEHGALKTANDAHNLAKKVEGEELKHAGHYESQYLRWQGIAESYSDMVNSVKDMVKSAKHLGE